MYYIIECQDCKDYFNFYDKLPYHVTIIDFSYCEKVDKNGGVLIKNNDIYTLLGKRYTKLCNVCYRERKLKKLLR
jgi:hypothetical protein